jgi:predicted nucleic acid-binding protein
VVGQALRAAEERLQVETGSAHLGLRQRGPALTLYLDSSALAKLFLEESGRDVVSKAVEGAGIRATSRLSYVECGDAFARAHREGRAPKGQLSRMIDALDEAWRDIAVVELDERVAGRAVAIARERPVRASDAIHLASALAVASGVGDLMFACFDRRLWETAGALGIDRVPQSAP